MECVLLNQLMFWFILHENLIIKTSIFCWTDSLDCLFWIYNTNKNWKQFIKARVLKINYTLDDTSWLFCPKVQNPADIPTIGSYLKDDDIKKFWLEWPPFLQLSQEDESSAKNFKIYKFNESHCSAELSNSGIDRHPEHI